MIAFEIVTWWYGQGWVQILKAAEKRFVNVSHMFSVPILVRTLFAPWRRIVSRPGAGLQAKFQASVDNFVGRFIGFCVRSLVLLAAGVMLSVVALSGVLQLVVWPLLPLMMLISIVKAIIG